MSEIDPAQAFEQNVIDRMKPVYQLMDLGDSDIQQFYDGVTVFMTGGSGFIGKHLIEKLLRSCNIKKLYILSRPKKGQTIEQRQAATLSNTLFDTLREKRPNFAEKIISIEGDIEDIGLGISKADRVRLTEEVNIIFHVAATVRFDEPLKKATLTNVRGTRETLQLAKECSNLQKFVHVSTAFTHATKSRIDKEVLEEFYPSPVPPEALISFAEETDEERFNDITMPLIEGWPNTYTFTKAVAEELIRTSAGDLPVCVVRPPIVIPSYAEPKPGWLDYSTVAGPSGIYLAIGLGILRVFCVDGNVHLAMAPIDYVNNTIIAAVWDSTKNRQKEKEIPVYTIAKKERFLQWNFLGSQMRKKAIYLSTPKAVWRCELIETKKKWLYTFLSWFLHYVPAFCFDVICTVLNKRPQGITSFVDIYRKIDKLADVYNYFLRNEWNFRDDNVQAMFKKMSPVDRKIFNCDLMTIDLQEYVIVWALGLRRYIIKDNLKGTKRGNRKQEIFRILNYIVLILYVFVLWYIFSSVFMVGVNLIF